MPSGAAKPGWAPARRQQKMAARVLTLIAPYGAQRGADLSYIKNTSPRPGPLN